MAKRTLLEESGQSWKLYTGVLVTVAAKSLDWMTRSAAPSTSFVVGSIEALMAVGAGAWMCWSIRCPRCAAKCFWIGASQYPIDGLGGHPRTGQPACVVCGWPGEDRRSDLENAEDWASSIGSIAAFFGGLAVVFTSAPWFTVLTGHRAEAMPDIVFTTGGLLAAIGGARAAKHALSAPKGRRALAVIGLWLSRVGLLVGLSAIPIVLWTDLIGR